MNAFVGFAMAVLMGVGFGGCLGSSDQWPVGPLEALKYEIRNDGTLTWNGRVEMDDGTKHRQNVVVVPGGSAAGDLLLAVGDFEVGIGRTNNPDVGWEPSVVAGFASNICAGTLTVRFVVVYSPGEIQQTTGNHSCT